MKAMQRRTFAFDARSVLLFTALSLGGAAALQAQTAPAAAPKAQGGPSYGPTTSSTNSTAPTATGSSSPAAFDRADANADGKLSAEEAATLPAIGNRFEQLDADRDSSLSRTEFEKGAKF
jgi:ABC-type phosphate transport system substrate-binding protein